MADDPKPSTFPFHYSAGHYAAPGDWGTIRVRVLRDWGDVLKVEHFVSGIGGGNARWTFWVARRDFVPAPPLAP